MTRPAEVHSGTHPAGSLMPNNLPIQESSFVGRTSELERLDQLVRSHRLVTIAGLGGIGKTRLALHYAGAAISSFPEGAWFISLRQVQDPARLALAAVEALSITAAGDCNVRGLLFEHLWKARTLLVLDNAEHLTQEVASFVRELLAATCDVRIIVTSREVLQVEDEQVLWLGSIDNGLRLFSDRAYSERPDLELAPSVRNAIANICTRLQGVPLAIELAAARAPSIPPEKLAETLEQLCETSATLEQMIEWSYQLLGSEERYLLKAISLFEGSFSIDAAEAVAGLSGLNGPALASSLVNKSLLATSGQADNNSGYYLLDTVRDFARKQLRQSPDVELVTRRYVDYYLHYLEVLEYGALSDSQLVAKVNREWINVNPALHRALDDGIDFVRVYGVIRGLWRFWLATGREREGIYWLERALARAELPKNVRVELLDAAARMAASSQDFARLEPLAEKLVAERQSADDPKALGDAFFMLANAKYMRGAYDEAQRLYSRAFEQFDVSGSRRGAALVLGTLGAIKEQRTISDERDLAEARTLLQRSLEIFREEEAALPSAQALENLGVVCMRAGNLREALAYTKESLALYREYGNSERAAIAHISVAEVYLASGAPLEALAELKAGRRAAGNQARGLFAAYYVECGFKAAVAVKAFPIAARLYGYAQRYRQVICIPTAPAEQAALRARHEVLEEVLGAETVRQLEREGASLDIAEVDELFHQASNVVRSTSLGRSVEDPLLSDASLNHVAHREPLSRRPLLQRMRLSLRIQHAAAYPAVFVTANGAWGKSLALNHYLANSGLPVIRTRLEANATLLSMLESFAAVVPGAAAAVALSKNARHATELLLDWLSEFRGAIVLDDLQHGDNDPQIAAVLAEFIRQTQSETRWFLASRNVGQAPLGTCMAYGLTGEPIGERDLAFTLDETIDYAALMHLALSQADAEAVVALTDGWPVAVTFALNAYLAAIAMAPRDRQAYVERETESLAGFYLREQVFNPLSAYQRRFLLMASAMPGNVRVDVLRQLDPAAEHTISSLFKRIPMRPVSNGIFQLSRLFKLFLQSELSAWPDRSEVCKALVKAYERIGDPASAVKVLLYITDYDSAGTLLVKHAQVWANADWPELLDSVLAQVPAQLLESNPAMLLVRAALAERNDRFTRALQLLERARTCSDAVIVMRAVCVEAALRLNNRRAVPIDSLEAAIELIDPESVEALRTRALLCCSYAGQRREDAAAPLLTELLQYINELIIDEGTIDVVYWVALSAYRLGDYATGRELAARITGAYGRKPWLIVAQSHNLLALIALQTSAPLEQILSHRECAIDTAKELKGARFYAELLRHQCALVLFNGDAGRVKAAMDDLVVHGGQLWVSYSVAFRFLTSVGQAASATSMERSIEAYAVILPIARALDVDPAFTEYRSLLLACLILVGCLSNEVTIKELIDAALSDDQMVKETPIAGEVPTFQRHLDLLRLVAIGCQSIVGVHQSMSWLSSHLDERAADPVVEATRTVIRSIVYKQRMRPTTAGNRHWPNVGLSNVSDALEYLRRAGYGIFAILFESLANKASTSQISDAALSKTELATLAYLAKGMKPAAIAAERHVSENTVRTQIKNLCGKLSVNSAQAAVARARVAGLLPPA